MSPKPIAAGSLYRTVNMMTNGPWTTELRVALGPGRAECSTGVPGARARASELLDWCGSAARHRGRVLDPVLRLTDSHKPAKLIYPHGLLGVLPSGDSQQVMCSFSFLTHQRPMAERYGATPWQTTSKQAQPRCVLRVGRYGKTHGRRHTIPQRHTFTYGVSSPIPTLKRQATYHGTADQLQHEPTRQLRRGAPRYYHYPFSISKSYRDYKQDGYATLTHKMSINKMAMPTPNSQDEYKQDGHGHAQ